MLASLNEKAGPRKDRLYRKGGRRADFFAPIDEAEEAVGDCPEDEKGEEQLDRSCLDRQRLAASPEHQIECAEDHIDHDGEAKPGSPGRHFARGSALFKLL